MNPNRISDNVTFRVNYAEGDHLDVPEGILFEFQGDNMTLHMGTNRINALFAIVEAVLETVQVLGLQEQFEKYYVDAGIFNEEVEQ